CYSIVDLHSFPTRRSSDLSEAEYHHSIEMPWEIVSTNADSVSHNSVYWNPRVVKFLLADYEMYAESRKINYWAFGVTLLCVGIRSEEHTSELQSRENLVCR